MKVSGVVLMGLGATLCSCAALQAVGTATGLGAAYAVLNGMLADGTISQPAYDGLMAAFKAIEAALMGKIDGAGLGAGMSGAVALALGIVRAWRGTSAPPDEKVERKVRKRTRRPPSG